MNQILQRKKHLIQFTFYKNSSPALTLSSSVAAVEDANFRQCGDLTSRDQGNGLVNRFSDIARVCCAYHRVQALVHHLSAPPHTNSLSPLSNHLESIPPPGTQEYENWLNALFRQHSDS